MRQPRGDSSPVPSGDSSVRRRAPFRPRPLAASPLLSEDLCARTDDRRMAILDAISHRATRIGRRSWHAFLRCPLAIVGDEILTRQCPRAPLPRVWNSRLSMEYAATVPLVPLGKRLAARTEIRFEARRFCGLIVGAPPTGRRPPSSEVRARLHINPHGPHSLAWMKSRSRG